MSTTTRACATATTTTTAAAGSTTPVSAGEPTEARTPPRVPACEIGGIGKLDDPYPTYQRLRERYPVGAMFGAVGVFGYRDVAEVLRHPRVSTDDRNSAAHHMLVTGDRLSPAYLSQLDQHSFLHRDPPEHTRLRRLVTKVFTPRRTQALRPFIQRYVDRVLDAAAPSGRLELVEQLAYPLPIEVICELIGIPAEDRGFVASWPRTQLCCSFEMASLSAQRKAEQAGPDRQVEADRIQQQLADYFALLIDRRHHQQPDQPGQAGRPGQDLITALITAEEDGDQLSVEEINATLRLMFVAGYENAVNLIGHGTLALLRHPDQWAALREDPTLAGQAVDEALRYDAPFQFTRRIALDDLDIGGHRVRAGQHIIAYLAAANRDPEQFEAPDRFDIHRTPNHHLSFGTGIHACLGGPLARLQAEIVFTTLTQRLTTPRLEAEPPRYRDDVFRSLAELPIRATIRPAT